KKEVFRDAGRVESQARAPVQAHQAKRQAVGTLRRACGGGRGANREQDPSREGGDEGSARQVEERRQQVEVQLQPAEVQLQPQDFVRPQVVFGPQVDQEEDAVAVLSRGLTAAIRTG